MSSANRSAASAAGRPQRGLRRSVLAITSRLSSPVRRASTGPLGKGTMQTIFVMVKCQLGKAYEVADDACSVEQVSEVYSTSGQYNLLMKCYLDDKTDIGHFVTSKIQTLARHPGHLHPHHLQGVQLAMAASAGGKAALAIWVDIDPADNSAFEHWHSREHVQERVACPGWLRGSRYKGARQARALLPLLRCRNGARARKRRLMPLAQSVRDEPRRLPEVPRHLAHHLLGRTTLGRRYWCGRPHLAHESGQHRAVRQAGGARDRARRPARRPGECRPGAHCGEGPAGPPRTGQIERALVAFFWSVEAAQAARARHAPQGEVFVLRHTVSKDDLP